MKLKQHIRFLQLLVLITPFVDASAMSGDAQRCIARCEKTWEQEYKQCMDKAQPPQNDATKKCLDDADKKLTKCMDDCLEGK